MHIDDFLARLEKVRKRGDQWESCCPAHEDGSPSLGVALGDDGRILAHCHAGCDINSICAALSITLRDLMPNSDASSSRPRARKKKTYATKDDAAAAILKMVRNEHGADWDFVSTHAYCDATGEPRMLVLRLGAPDGAKKTYRPIHRVGDGWQIGDLEGPLPLYRLDEIEGTAAVVVVEGEKAADAGAKIGLPTTTSAHGAKSPQKSDWSPLAGRDVAILPDNDRAGSIYAHRVASLVTELSPPARVRFVELPDLPEHGDLFDFIETRRAAGASNDAIRDEVLALIARSSELDPNDLACEPALDDRVKVELVVGDLARCIDKIEAALGARAMDLLVFQRGDLMVQIIRADTGTTLAEIARLRGAARIRARDAHAVADLVNRVVRLVERVRTQHGLEEKATDCPIDVARMMLARQHWPSVPTLTGITQSPMILPDGRILARDGYDAGTGVFVELGGLELPPIPEQPSVDQAAAALDSLRELLDEFPFERPADCSVAVAALLTALSRDLYRHVPLLGCSARARSSGKSFLIECIGYIATGRAATVTQYTPDQAEARKRIFAMLLEGRRLVNIDNVSIPIESDALCSALTEDEFTDRVLGQSRTASAPTRQTMFFANGNGLVVKGDLCRRTLVCGLDARIPDPSIRVFKRDLRKYIVEHRASVIAAAMIVLRRALQTVDRPRVLRPFASFEDWSHVVRRILVDLGMPDPCEVLSRNNDLDPDLEALRVLAIAWHGRFGDTPATARDAVALADEALSAAMELVASDPNGRISVARLGNFLRTRQGRVIDRWRFEKIGERQGWALWRLITVAPPDSVTLESLETDPRPCARARACAPARAREGVGNESHESHATAPDGPSSGRVPSTPRSEQRVLDAEMLNHRGPFSYDDGGDP